MHYLVFLLFSYLDQREGSVERERLGLLIRRFSVCIIRLLSACAKLSTEKVTLIMWTVAVHSITWLWGHATQHDCRWLRWPFVVTSANRDIRFTYIPVV